MSRRALSSDQENQCVDALMLLGIDHPDHPVLSHRGYFAMYLGRLTPDEMESCGGTGGDDFRRLRKMLSVMGQDRLRDLVAARAALRPPKANPAESPRDENWSDPSKLAQNVEAICDTDSPTAHMAAPFARDGTQSDVLTLLEEKTPSKPHLIRPLPEHLSKVSDGDVHGMTEYILGLANSARYHDAFDATVEFLDREGPEPSVLKACVVALNRASAYDRDHGVAPVNVLHEFEHLAHTLMRYCPDMSTLTSEAEDEDTRESYLFIRRLYKAWLSHCRALLEFKFRLRNQQWMRRQWIEPEEFGILLDLFRAAERSRLPMDLMARNYRGAKECLAIGDEVIVLPEKQARLKAEGIRVFAPVFRERYDDLLFLAYQDIAMAFAFAHDRIQALKFVNEAAAMRPHVNLDELRMGINEAMRAPLSRPKEDPFQDLVRKVHQPN